MKNPNQVQQPIKELLWLAHATRLWTHATASIDTTKKKPLMVHNSGMCTSGKKWIKKIMKTPIHLNSNGKEVIVWCSFTIWLCLPLNNHYSYMCYCHWCVLHHIYASQVSNDNVHQGLEIIFGGRDIHLLSSVVNEKVGDLLLNMCSTFWCNSYDNISKCIVNYYMFISIRALKQMGI